MSPFPTHWQDKNTELHHPALEELRRLIRSSTTSMTSVPKPLKFLRPHYGKLKETYEGMAAGENKVWVSSLCCSLLILKAMQIYRIEATVGWYSACWPFAWYEMNCHKRNTGINTNAQITFPRKCISKCRWCVYLQHFCADVVSVLAMTMSGERECLKYRLLGSQEELASWGHEYVR